MNLRKSFYSVENNASWKFVIVSAIICGCFTGIILNLESVLIGTSIFNIGTDFEFWIFAAIIIIMGCDKPLEAGVKTFVFFLISQPLVFFVKAPFSTLGLGVFKDYKGWFIWTLFTFSGAMIGWNINKKNWLSVIIYMFAVFLLSMEFGTHFSVFIRNMLYQILSLLFIVVQLIYYGMSFTDKKLRTVFFVLCVLFLTAGSVIMFDN